MRKKKPNEIPLLLEQAYECLNIVNGSVHSFCVEFYGLAGADLELPRVKAMLENAAAQKKLFLSDELACVAHNILTWDQKYEQWTYLECRKDRLKQLTHVD